MTTWHEKEPLPDVLEFWLLHSFVKAGHSIVLGAGMDERLRDEIGKSLKEYLRRR